MSLAAGDELSLLFVLSLEVKEEVEIPNFLHVVSTSIELPKDPSSDTFPA